MMEMLLETAQILEGQLQQVRPFTFLGVLDRKKNPHEQEMLASTEGAAADEGDSPFSLILAKSHYTDPEQMRTTTMTA